MTEISNEKIKSYSSATVNRLGGSRVEIIGSIPAENWERYRPQAIKKINESITIDGFRKGNVPENILIAKMGDMAILEEMAELALSKTYVEIITDENIDALGKPEISVTKLAKGNPLEFKAITAVTPEFKLPDYKILAKKEVSHSSPDELIVTDKELEEAIIRVRKSQVSHADHDHSKMTAEEHEKATEASMPALTDDFVKKLGDFNDIPDFKSKLSVMLAEEKKSVAKDKLRIKIADAIVAKTVVEIPDVMIESELNRTKAQFEADIERMGVKMDDYLKHAKKSMEDIRKEWRPHAEKKVKLQLILNAIAKAENIKPDRKEIDAEVDHILEHYKDADREHAAIYAETVLTNEKVFQFLEK